MRIVRDQGDGSLVDQGQRSGLRFPPPASAGWSPRYVSSMEVLSSRVLLKPTDPERSRKFYAETLGLAIYREFPGGTVFFLGHGFLEVVGKGSAGGSPDLSLWLQVRDLQDTVAELVLKGVTLDREPRRESWGLLEAWISDPDGTRIVLVEVPPDHPLRVDTR